MNKDNTRTGVKQLKGIAQIKHLIKT